MRRIELLLFASLLLSLAGRADQNDLNVLINHAHDGDPAAQFELGMRLETGVNADPDEAQARQWYRRATEQGHIEATARLGALYYEGRGGQKDFARAFEMIDKAAGAGLAISQHDLALMYMNGHGVDVNPDRAAEWMRSAARQGHTDAQLRLAEFYESGYGVRNDPVNALMWALLADHVLSNKESNALRKRLESRLTAAAIDEAEKRAFALEATLSR